MNYYSEIILIPLSWNKKCLAPKSNLVFFKGLLVTKRLFRGMFVFSNVFCTIKIWFLPLELTISWNIGKGWFILFKNFKIVKILIYPWGQKN